MALERQVVLECVQPAHNHNKFYEITVDHKNEKYYVDCRWGRIEHFKDGSPQSQRKLTTSDKDKAMDEVATIMYSKLKKGYTIVKDTTVSTPSYTSKEFERTEHVESIALNWWAAGEVIEERVV